MRRPYLGQDSPVKVFCEIILDSGIGGLYQEGMKLKRYLERKKETQTSFADRCGVSRQLISLICKGAGTQTRTAIKIVEATGGRVRYVDLTGD